MRLKKEEIERLRKLARSNLFFLTRAILGYRELTKDFHLELCQFLTDRERFKLVCLPRGFFKTTICTVSQAIWNTLRDPTCSQLICCQRAGNAQKMVDEIRSHWDGNDLLRALYPNMIPKGNQRWSSERADLPTNDQPECSYESAGIGTQLQSRHYDHLIADDLVVPQKDQVTGVWMQPTEEDIQKAIGWHQLSWGLMKEVQYSTYTQIMTRWCPDDLFYYLTEKDSADWQLFLRAAEDEEGNATFPEKYPKDILEDIRCSQGPYKYSTQYLCKPIASGQCMFADTYNIYTADQTPTKFKKVFAACDPAISKKKGAHLATIVVVGLTERGERYILDYYAEQGPAPSELVDNIIRLWRIYHFRVLALETIAYQEAVEHMLKDRFKQEGGRLFRIETFTPGRGDRKPMRIEAMEPSFSAGWWFVRNDQRLLQTQLDEYPYGTYDDLLDALAYVNKLLPAHEGYRSSKEPEETTPANVITYEQIMEELQSVKGSRTAFDLQRPDLFRRETS